MATLLEKYKSCSAQFGANFMDWNKAFKNSRFEWDYVRDSFGRMLRDANGYFSAKLITNEEALKRIDAQIASAEAALASPSPWGPSPAQIQQKLNQMLATRLTYLSGDLDDVAFNPNFNPAEQEFFPVEFFNCIKPSIS